MDRMGMSLRTQGFLLGPYQLNFTYKVFPIPSTGQPQTEVTTQIPAHAWRLLSSHNLSGSIPPKVHPSPFGCTLAKLLDFRYHCVPLLWAVSSPMYLYTIYRLSSTKRHNVLGMLHQDFMDHSTLIKSNNGDLHSLQEQYEAVQLILTLQLPIHYLPAELLAEIFLIAVERRRVSKHTLQCVCRSWRGVVARLWGIIRVGTWTKTQTITAVVKQNPLSTAVVMDTATDEALSITSETPYAALALACASALRWRSLTIKSFPSNANILTSSVTLFPLVPLENLATLSVGPNCDFTDGTKEIMEAIALAMAPKLISLTIAATNVLRGLNQFHWARIFSQLTVLEVDVIKVWEPVNLLHHCARLEVLKLSGVIMHYLSPDDELPLARTLRQLWLKQSPIQWMVGHAFERLENCTLLKPLDPHSFNPTCVIHLPVCTDITVQSHLVRILAAFHAPVARKISVECNQWSKPRGDFELSRVWSQRWNQGTLRPRVLSLKLFCGDLALLEALCHMVELHELVLDLPCPSALGAFFFEAMCAMPMMPFTGRTEQEWFTWAETGTRWQAKICPYLLKLHLRYERWTRKVEEDTITPTITAVVWSREKLLLPLLEFKFMHKDREVDLKGPAPTTNGDHLKLYKIWGDLLVYRWLHQKIFVHSLIAAITRSIGFADSVFPIEIVPERYHCSILSRLRAFRHHPPAPPRNPCDILSLFEHLEELDVSNFHFKPCPPAVSFPLCRTLRVLHIRDTPLDWMYGRIFKRVVECRIEVSNNICELSRAQIPACKKMEISGTKGRIDLDFCRLSTPDLPLELPHSPGMSALATTGAPPSS
jgi:hypothetical protein